MPFFHVGAHQQINIHTITTKHVIVKALPQVSMKNTARGECRVLCFIHTSIGSALFLLFILFYCAKNLNQEYNAHHTINYITII